jgi:formylglycine-generating enzyme required for sulfatase activity
VWYAAASLLSAFLPAPSLEAAEIRLPRVEVEGGRYVWKFDLAGGEGEKAVVSLSVRVAGRRIRPLDLVLSGDTGLVTVGKGKRIVWAPGEAAPERTDVEWELTATEPAWRDPSTGMEFVYVEGGCFSMGDASGEGFEDEGPPHEACVSSFYMARHEVTVRQFAAFARATGYKTLAERKGGCTGWNGKEFRRQKNLCWSSPGFPQDDSHPVTCVSHKDAEAFAAWLSRGSSHRFRLPTEAEWEFAATSRGKARGCSWGSGPPAGNVADESLAPVFPTWERWSGYDDGHRFTAPVGSYPPNELGIHDLTGNVWEWCGDWYDAEHYAHCRRQDPGGPASGEDRSLRGGSWFFGPGTWRVTYRYRLDPAERYDDDGFRLVFTPR